jgi:hypothetical protein
MLLENDHELIRDRDDDGYILQEQYDVTDPSLDGDCSWNHPVYEAIQDRLLAGLDRLGERMKTA